MKVIVRQALGLFVALAIAASAMVAISGAFAQVQGSAQAGFALVPRDGNHEP